MCGIVGFFGDGGKETLARMTGAVAHRGPDSSDTFSRGNVHLGHTRLAIIDISPSGAQPMLDTTRDTAITFNGEIYNYQELRDEVLRRDNTPFRSSSDTEVILRLYALEGSRCFARLNGMFALALYDFRERKLVLARDRLGKKPLYWTERNDTLVFGSELKVLAEHPEVTLSQNERAVFQYFFYDYVPTPGTIYKDVYKLEPGTVLTYKGGEITTQSFWEPSFTTLSTRDVSFQDALKGFDAHLERSVASRLMSDVPLGVFLSGGIDSSAIAYYAQKASGEPMKTFAIGFDEKSFDESSYARSVAEYLGTDHHEKNVSAADMLAVIDKLPQMLDEPIADASVIPTYLLSEFTKEHVTVTLGGDGGDELLAGYPTFRLERVASMYQRIPKIMRTHIVEEIVGCIPASERNMHFAFKMQKFIEGRSSDVYMRHQEWLSSWSGPHLENLFMPDFYKEHVHDLTQPFKPYLAEHQDVSKENLLLYMYLRTYLMDLVLVKLDRASMAHGLEARTPFLDYELVEYVMRLPYSYKYHRGTHKYLLKELMKDKLPPHIVKRPKKGFGIPLAAWLRNDLKDVATELLSPEKLNESGYFNTDYIQKLWNEHQSGKVDHRKRLWPVLMFQLWQQEWKR